MTINHQSTSHRTSEEELTSLANLLQLGVDQFTLAFVRWLGRLMMAFKIEHRQWLEDHGVWEQCWRRKEELKEAGYKPAEAQRKALFEFHRPDDAPAVGPAQAGTVVVNP